MGYLPSFSLSQSLHTLVGQVISGRKDGRSTCFRLCDRFSSSRQASGWLWLPLPLLYNGQTHFQCTYSDSPTPWCATAVDSNNQVVTNGWGDCAVSATSACQTESIQVPTCTTTSGPRPGQSCVFPFRHLGIVYTACTSVGEAAPWCSTSTTSAGTHIDGEYGFCPSTCPADTTSSAT